MVNTLSIENERILLDLYALLRDIDPSRWRNDIDAALRDRLCRIQAAAMQMIASWRSEGKMDAIRCRVDELVGVLREHAPRNASCDALREEWMLFRRRVAPFYESLALMLQRQAIQVPMLRPTNYARSLLHISCGLLGIMCLEILLPLHVLPWAAGGFALYCWTMEAMRRIWPWWNSMLFKFPLFRVTAHPREIHNVNSATWFATSTTILAFVAVYHSPIAALAAMTIATFGDPAAATVGRKWGKIVLLRGRTLEGSLAFIATGTAVVLVFFRLFHFDVLSWSTAVAVTLASVICGCITELVTKRLDDNFTVPLASAAGASVALWVWS